MRPGLAGLVRQTTEEGVGGNVGGVSLGEAQGTSGINVDLLTARNFDVLKYLLVIGFFLFLVVPLCGVIGCVTYHGVSTCSENGCVARGANNALNVRAVGRGATAQPELLSGGVHLAVVDGRSRADGHDAECWGSGGGTGSWGWGGSSQQREGDGSKDGLHCDDCLKIGIGLIEKLKKS